MELTAQQLTQAKADLDRFFARQKEKLGDVDQKQLELQARLSEVEQKLAKSGSVGDPGASYHDAGGAALRALLEDHAELKAVADGRLRRTVIELPTGFFKAAITSGGGLALPETMPGIVAPVQRRLTIRALIPSVPTTSGSVQYTREVSYTNAAATVSETTEKPESSITFQLKTSAIPTIAHFVRASNQVLADTPQLQGYIDLRLRYGLAIVEENQLLKGSGIGNNLEGMLTAATAYNRTTGGDTRIDTLRRAITQLEDTDYQATGFVLHPFDWEAITLIKTTTGEYVVGAPNGGNTPTLWGRPVIPTSAQTAGTFLVGDFPQSAVIFDREQARIDISTEDGTNFRENMCTIRGEERIGLAILRTGGLIKGTF